MHSLCSWASSASDILLVPTGVGAASAFGAGAGAAAKSVRLDATMAAYSLIKPCIRVLNSSGVNVVMWKGLMVCFDNALYIKSNAYE